jgi:hypothetical protein
VVVLGFEEHEYIIKGKKLIPFMLRSKYIFPIKDTAIFISGSQASLGSY